VAILKMSNAILMGIVGGFLLGIFWMTVGRDESLWSVGNIIRLLLGLCWLVMKILASKSTVNRWKRISQIMKERFRLAKCPRRDNNSRSSCSALKEEDDKATQAWTSKSFV